ncbi:MAG: cysteine desulfurase family protein [Rhodothermales bacterium]
MSERIYLDHAATTPLDLRVLEVMLPYLTEHYGNASSVHALGRRARFAVEESREQVAALLGAEPSEIVFTSGGTEADNAALKGAVVATQRGLLTSTVEHEAVLQTAHALAQQGHAARLLTPGRAGTLTPNEVAEQLDDTIGLVSVMHINNETGAEADIAAIAAVCRAKGVVLHTDAVQSVGLYALKVDALGVDLLSASAHKFYGPKGIGFLYVRGGTDLPSFVHGGAQERKRRGGTENVAAIVGMAEALKWAYREHDERLALLTALRDRLKEELVAALGDSIQFNTPFGNGHVAPHIVNLSFVTEASGGLDGEMLLLNMDMEGVAVSSGSACTSGAVEPSHVLLALGGDPATAAATIRFSLGRHTTVAHIDRAVETLVRVHRRMALLA